MLKFLFFTSAVLAAAFVWQRWKISCLMKKLDKMLDAAIEGKFIEQHFDETKLSALESKLDRYLSVSETAAKSLASEKDKIKELISDISHQTKIPIANVLLYTQLLAEQRLSAESQNYVAALQIQAEKMNFLTSTLVKISRLETGVLNIRPQKNPLQPLLTDLELQYRSKAKAKQLNFSIEASDEQAVFDRKWTEEAIGNLIDNAIKYTQAGGSVEVTVTTYPLFLRLDVLDTGIGISENAQAKVFTRFYRSSEVADQEGLGLGLYLTREILTKEGGYLKLRSESGKGSQFSAFLPRRP